MISILVPLYASNRWLPVIERNIEQALSIGAEVIVSDRHGLDETLSQLRQRFDGAPDTKFLETLDGGDFTVNINALINAATRDFFRIVPHDDDAPAVSSLRLLKTLRQDPKAVLAYGDIEHLDADGRPFSYQTRHGHEPAHPDPWPLSDVLPIFWSRRYDGAFKSLIRTEAVTRHNLFIRRLPDGWYSERAWLFALGLAGRFARSDGFMLRKRYYEQSTHRQWRHTPDVIKGGALVLESYARDFIQNEEARALAIEDIRLNADVWTRHPKPTPLEPGHTALPSPDYEKLKALDVLKLGFRPYTALQKETGPPPGKTEQAVTICIPTWQSAEFIKRTIDCASRQRYENLYILISVDQSEDSTADLCRRRARDDPRMTILEQSERLGWAANVNVLLDTVDTEFYAILFHDDLVHPDWISAMLEPLCSQEEAGAAVCAMKEGASVKHGSPHIGDSFNRLMTRMTGPLKGAPLRALCRRSSFTRPVRFPAVSPLGFQVQEAYLFDLIAQAPLLYVPKMLYYRENDRDGGVTRKWQSMPPEDMKEDLRITAHSIAETIEREIEDVDQRRILRECARLHMMLMLLSFENDRGLRTGIESADLFSKSNANNIADIVATHYPQYRQPLVSLRQKVEDALTQQYRAGHQV